MRNPKVILITILAVLVLIFILQNTDDVETRFLFLKLTAPRAVWLFGTFLIGFVLGALTVMKFGFSRNSV